VSRIINWQVGRPLCAKNYCKGFVPVSHLGMSGGSARVRCTATHHPLKPLTDGVINTLAVLSREEIETGTPAALGDAGGHSQDRIRLRHAARVSSPVFGFSAPLELPANRASYPSSSSRQRRRLSLSVSLSRSNRATCSLPSLSDTVTTLVHAPVAKRKIGTAVPRSESCWAQLMRKGARRTIVPASPSAKLEPRSGWLSVAHVSATTPLGAWNGRIVKGDALRPAVRSSVRGKHSPATRGPRLKRPHRREIKRLHSIC